MLGLTRKAGQQILIGDDVIMEVEWIRGNTVRLKFDAPKDVDIYRPEYVAMKLNEELDLTGGTL